jgi:hypothetical protein
VKHEAQVSSQEALIGPMFSIRASLFSMPVFPSGHQHLASGIGECCTMHGHPPPSSPSWHNDARHLRHLHGPP